MAGIPTVGDILMLSQLAWRIGRTFTTGRKDAPQEFLEVEAEVNGLSKALKRFAEGLFANHDDDILAHADEATKSGVAKVLHSAMIILKDLDSIVAEYQVTVKTNTAGGFTVERTWSPIVISNFRAMVWTVDGGNIVALRDMLRMLRSSISMLVQAIQSNSVVKLAAVVKPVAENTSLSKNRGDIENIMDKLRGSVPSSVSHTQQLDTVPEAVYQVNDKADTHARLHSVDSEATTLSGSTGLLSSSLSIANSLGSQRSTSQSSLQASRSEKGVSVYSLASSKSASRPITPHASTHSMQSYTVSPNVERRLSRHRMQSPFQSPKTLAESESRNASRRNSMLAMELLPQPSIPIDEDIIEPIMSNLSLAPTARPQSIKSSPSRSPSVRSNTIRPVKSSQQYAFEKAAFRNSAILCDIRATCIEYTRPTTEEPDPFGVELVKAMEKCRICIVRKRQTLPNDKVEMSTSIWAFSEDGSVRMQQKLDEDYRYVPYSSFFQREKISIAVPTELHFHDTAYGAKPLKTVRTSWINYVIADNEGAAQFQTEIMSRNLLATFRTEKTVRLHEGLAGVLAYQEQMCGMENLRMWEDEETGGVFAMIHYSAQFRLGYMAFWLNNSNDAVRIKDDGGKEVKIKGLKIRSNDAAVLARKDSAVATGSEKSKKASEAKKWITGAKVEFSSEAEKYAFLNKVKDIQTKMVALPEL